MRSTSTEESAAFDRTYEKVPAEQVARLKEFRLTHPYKQLFVGETKWEYISCGQGEQTLLLLPGALSVGESTFPLITSLENEYRIIAPSYALSLTMMGLIIESDDDPAIAAHDRALLRSTYPGAQVYTFRDAGHASSILKREGSYFNYEKFSQQRRLGCIASQFEILLCATSVFSVPLWLTNVWEINHRDTETQRTQRLHREEFSS